MRRATLAFIFVTVALDMLALGIMVPVLPKLVLEFEGGDTARAAIMIGLFTTVFAAVISNGRSPTLSGAPYLLAAAMLAVGFVLSWRAT
jgi:hypothetical protein